VVIKLYYKASMKDKVRGEKPLTLPQELKVEVVYWNGEPAMQLNDHITQIQPVFIGHVICKPFKDVFLYDRTAVKYPALLYLSKGVHDFTVILPPQRFRDVLPPRHEALDVLTTDIGFVDEMVLEGVAEVV